MATNNTQQKAAPKKEQKSVPAVTARIDRMVDFEGSKTKAIASANIGGAFAIHGIKIMDSDKGLFKSISKSIGMNALAYNRVIVSLGMKISLFAIESPP